MNNSAIKAHLQMLGFTFLLGGSFIASATISNNLSPMVIIWLRYAFASVLFILLLAIQGLLTLPTWRDFGRYTLISLPPLLYFTCMIFALRETSAVDSSALYTTVPFMSLVMSLVLLKKRATLGTIIALLVGILGALLIIFKGDLEQVVRLQFTTSNVLFLFGCLGMGLNPIAVKMLNRNDHPMVMTGWSIISATLLLTLMVAYELPSIKWAAISGETWGGIFYLSTFATALSFFLFQRSCIALTPTQVSGYVYLIPLSVICTNVVMGVTFNWGEVLLGVILVIAAMVMLVRTK